jgi:hypothetical protein
MNTTALLACLAVAGVVAGPAAATGDDYIGAIATDRTAVWAWTSPNQMVRMDPSTGAVKSRTRTEGTIADLAIGAEGVWGVAICAGRNCGRGGLMRFDPSTGRQIGRMTLLRGHPRAVAVGGGSVWALGYRRLLRIDPKTGRLATGGSISVGLNAQDVAVGGGRVWVTFGGRPGSAGRCGLVGIDAPSGRIEVRRRVPCLPRAVAFGLGRPWTTRSTGIPRSSVDLITGFGRVWVSEVRTPRPDENGQTTGVAHVTGIDPGNGTTVSTAVASTPGWIPRIAVGAGGRVDRKRPAGSDHRHRPCFRKNLRKPAAPVGTHTGRRFVEGA